MKIQTAITTIKNNEEFIHGQPLETLIKEKSFSETIYLLLSGRFPTTEHVQMLNALLVAAIDHGPGTASAQVARIVASAKSSLHVSVAAGILAMGERHGSAIEGAAQFFAEHKSSADISALVKTLKEQKVRVPGFGHPFLVEDKRGLALFALAKELNIFATHCAFATSFHTSLNEQSSKPLPLNIDGAMAAILLDMGFPVAIMKGFFLIARVPGLVAQSYEEMTHDVGIRRLDEGEIEYQD